MIMRATAVVTTALALAFASAQLGSAAAGGLSSDTYAPSRADGALVAKVVVATVARAHPGAGARVWRVGTFTQWSHGPQQLLVLERALDSRGIEWLKVRLPIRPNGSSGWIRADFTFVSRTPYWIDASLGRRLVSVYKRGRLLREFRAVVGAPSTPTPVGLHAVYDPIPQGDPNGFEGPWVIHLTATSYVFKKFDGGDGRIGIHGRGGGSLRDPLGTARSHGCIRVDNGAVRWLIRVIPRGTPVNVHR
jgi:lipoprotein-anchoring transpeptidase ErfK/SrfK